MPKIVRILTSSSAHCPLLSLTLRVRDEAVVDGKLGISVRLRYDGLPNGELRPIIARIDPWMFYNISWGRYQIFTDGNCVAESRLPFHVIYFNVRPSRDAHGRFVRDPVTIDESWTCLRPGEGVTYDTVLDLVCNNRWAETLQAGHEYWLRFGSFYGNSMPRPELKLWRFGTLEVSIEVRKSMFVVSSLSTYTGMVRAEYAL